MRAIWDWVHAERGQRTVSISSCEGVFFLTATEKDGDHAVGETVEVPGALTNHDAVARAMDLADRRIRLKLEMADLPAVQRDFFARMMAP